MTIFDILKDIISTKSKTLHLKPEFKKGFNRYIIIRYLSMDKRFEKVAEELNDYASQCNISDEDLYLIMTQKLPKCRNSFIKYIKKPKAESKDTTL